MVGWPGGKRMTTTSLPRAAYSGADIGFPADGVVERLERVCQFAGWTWADTIAAWIDFRTCYKDVLPNHHLAVAFEAQFFIWIVRIYYDIAWEARQS